MTGCRTGFEKRHIANLRYAVSIISIIRLEYILKAEICINTCFFNVKSVKIDIHLMFIFQSSKMKLKISTFSSYSYAFTSPGLSTLSIIITVKQWSDFKC